MAADKIVDEEETNELPTITVEGRKNLNTIVLGKEELRPLASATSDTASLLRNIPGLNIQGGGGVSSLPVIHGLASDRVRIKVDGMDLISACGNHMNPALSYIDPSNVDTAVVFAGITPVSVGGDSIGGAIIVESPAPEFASDSEKLLTTGEIGAFYRSNGNAQGGNLTATIASENLSLSYRGSTVKADNYTAGDDFKPAGYAAPGREWLDGDEVGSTMYKSTNQSISVAWRQDNHLLQLTYGEQDIPYQGWVNQRMDMTGNDSEQINLRYEGQYGWGDLEVRFYNEHTRHKMQFYDDKLFWYLEGEPCTPSPTCAAGMPMDTEGNNTGATIKAEIPLSAGELLRMGAEFQQYRMDDWWEPSGRGMWPDTFWNIHNGERDRLALYGEWEKQWNPQWQTLFGVRGEQVDMDAGDVQGYSYEKYGTDSDAFNAADHEKTDYNIDITALARFTPNKKTTLEFGYARKTRSPNLYERYTWSTGGMAMRMINWAGDGNGYVGNLDLEPEIAHTLSATFSLHDPSREKWGLSFTPYYTYVDDYIDATRLPDQETLTEEWVYLRFVNQSAQLYGLDISGYVPLAENTPYGNFTATGILGYVRGKNDDTDDNLYNMMPLNAKLSVVHTLNKWTNTIEVEMVDDKTDVSWERNEIQTDSYSLLHLRSSYKWKRVRIDFGIENVFDTFYNHPLGGVYMGQGVTMTGTNPTKPYVPWGLAAPGMGRSIYAGINFKF
ncbi:TonB-dependent receptor plug domain-containing protein [Thiolapillus sp.]